MLNNQDGRFIPILHYQEKSLSSVKESMSPSSSHSDQKFFGIWSLANATTKAAAAAEAFLSELARSSSPRKATRQRTKSHELSLNGRLETI